MIDLSKNQIVDPCIQAWFRDDDTKQWTAGLLASIDHRAVYPYRKTEDSYTFSYRQCTIEDPYAKKIKQWKTVEDVPAEAWGGWIKPEGGFIFHRARLLEPESISDSKGVIYERKLWMPRGENPVTGVWRKMESEVGDES